MPIPLPNLDDRTYADLFEEMRALIPRYAPGWTDHNDSDPGITLLQLFAWRAEGIMYRLDRIPLDSEAAFLGLLSGWQVDLPPPDADPALRRSLLALLRAQVIADLRGTWRAVTPQDFETLALADSRVARARCLPERDLSADDPETPRPGHVSVIIVPQSGDAEPQPSPELVDSVHALLDERRLITCRHHVLGPGYTRVSLAVTVVRAAEVTPGTVEQSVEDNLCDFLSPFIGGPDGGGWPFGRDVYASELYQKLESSYGVDHVESVVMKVQEADGRWQDAGDRAPVPENNLVSLASVGVDAPAR